MAAAARVEAAVIRACRLLLAVLLLAQSGAALAAVQGLVISGLGGDPDYEHRFAEWNTALTKQLRQLAGGDERVTSLAGAQATAANIEKAFAQLAQRTQREDSVIVVLVGHGTWLGEEYRYNIPGPDLTGAQFKSLLDKLPAERQLVVNTTSASGGTAEAWKRAGRIVITATRTGGERNATRFPQSFIEALSGDKADRDKDQIVSAAEAFAWTSEAVANSFKSDAAIATEHARMDGADPARFVVARLGRAAQHADDPQLQALQQRQDAMEQELAAVKARKASLPEDAYFEQLEPVLLRIARLGDEREARERQLGIVPSGATPGGNP
jgi:hypothetical protein